MKTIITLILTSVITLYSQSGHPEVEKFKLKGYENYNFNNVLLDPESPIEDFYLITDIGEILKVKNMGLDPIVQRVFVYDGDITEAESEGEIHYFSVVSETETMLLATTDFIDLDTIYQEDNAEITDFRIDRGKLYILSNNGTEGKISYTPIGENNWKEKDIPSPEFNRLFVMDSQMVLFMYLADDATLLYTNIDDKEWKEKNNFLQEFYKGYSDMQEIKGAKAIYGDSKHIGNNLYILDYKLDRYKVFFGPGYDNVYNSVGFRQSFDFDRDNLQIGKFMDDCECAFLFRLTFNGDIEKNMFKFLQTKSLNKIKSNKKSKNIQFVAVGSDGLVLLIDRQLTNIENEEEKQLVVNENANFTIFPNPVGNQSELNIECEEIINSLSITDISGKQSLNIYQIGQRNYTLPINNLASGVYFISVNGVSKKFVVE
ncbi:MAG: T9SS type A sorting domain-containing protein [Chlorobiota bacterium]